MNRMLVLAGFVALAGCAHATGAVSGDVAAPLVGHRDPTSSERAELDAIVAWAERHRGLSLASEVSFEIADEATIERYLAERVLPDRYAGTIATFVSLGLVSSTERDPLQLVPRGSVGTASIYRPEDRRIVVRADVAAALSGTSNADRRMQLSVLHTVVDAMQDDHGLGEVDVDGDLDYGLDHELAVRAIRDADGRLAMAQALARSTGSDVRRIVGLETGLDALARSVVAESPESDDDAIPPIVSAIEVGSQMLGWQLVTSRFHALEWAGVEDLYDASDRLTTEHLLHPELFEAGHEEEVRDLTILEPLEDRCERVDETTFGEFLFRTYFAAIGAADAQAAAAGWAGDRLGTYLCPDGTYATLWVSSWDTVRDAVDAADAARRIGREQLAAGGREPIVLRVQRVMVIAIGLDESEATTLRRSFESFVYDEFDDPRAWTGHQAD